MARAFHWEGNWRALCGQRSRRRKHARAQGKFRAGEGDSRAADRGTSSWIGLTTPSPCAMGLTDEGSNFWVPHRRNRQRWGEDGRKLPHHKKRWKVERIFDCLQTFHRLLVRQDRILSISRGG